MHTRLLCLITGFAVVATAADLRWSRSIVSDDPGLYSPVVARDVDGNLYLASTTRAVDVPVTPGVYQPALRTDNCFVGRERCRDLFISKYDGDGRVIWSTYLGTADDDLAVGLAVDAARSVYVAAMSNAFRPCVEPCRRYGWVTKLSPAGERVLGTVRVDGVQLSSMALTASAEVYVAGTTITQPQQGVIFVGKVSPGFDGFAYTARVPGGRSGSVARDLAITPAGEAIVVGQTASDDFPATANAFQPRSGGDADGFVVMLDRAGAPRWATYVGREGNDTVERVAIGPTGRAYLAVSTPAGLQLNVLDLNDARIQPLAMPRLNALPEALTTDRNGNLVLGGRTASGDWPVTQDAVEPVLYGIESGVISIVDSSNGRVLYASYIGRTGVTRVTGIAAGDDGRLYVAGQGMGGELPLEPPSPGGGFIAHIDVTATSPRAPRIRAVVNSASFTGGPLVRGELISIFGEEIGPGTPMTAEPVGGAYPRQLGGLEVFANGNPLPLLYASRTQVNATVPMRTDHPVIEIVIRNANGMTAPFRLAQDVAAIGVFTRDGSGRGQAAALNQDNSPNSSANPARKGSTVQLWVTGAGLTNPPQPDGSVAAAGDRSSTGLPVITLRNGSAIAQVLALYSGASPGMIAGVAQINFRIPGDAPTGPGVRLGIQHALAQEVTIAIAE
jgi:uncharacterized protein (TIGR03437 family)